MGAVVVSVTMAKNIAQAGKNPVQILNEWVMPAEEFQTLIGRVE